MFQIRHYTFLSSALLLALIGTAQAQSDTSTQVTQHAETTADQSRTLRGHTFLSSSLMPEPFVDTAVVSGTSMGVAEFGLGKMITLLPNQSPFDTLTLGFVRPSIRAQVGFLDRFALGLEATGTVLSALDSNAALIMGADVAVTVGGNVLWNIIQNEWVSLGFGVTGGYQRDVQLSPLTAINQTLEKQRLDSSNLFVMTDGYQVTPYLAFDVGFAPAVGIYTSFSYGFSGSDSGTGMNHTQELRFGGGLSLDLQADLHIPIGLSAGYLRTQPLEDGETASNQIEAGLFYTGKSDIQVGAHMNVQLQDLGDGATMTIYAGQFTVSAYF